MIYKFSDRNDTAKQIWGSKQSIYEFSDRDDIVDQV